MRKVEINSGFPHIPIYIPPSLYQPSNLPLLKKKTRSISQLARTITKSSCALPPEKSRKRHARDYCIVSSSPVASGRRRQADVRRHVRTRRSEISSATGRRTAGSSCSVRRGPASSSHVFIYIVYERNGDIISSKAVILCVAVEMQRIC